MDAPSSLWIVLDAEGRPEFAAGWREAAHEHIKDAIEIEVDETASRWVVREYVPVAERDRLRAEVEALKAKAAAFDEWHAKTEWVQETAEARELGMHRADVMRKRIEALRKAAQSVLDSAVDSEREALGLDELRRAMEGGE